MSFLHFNLLITLNTIQTSWIDYILFYLFGFNVYSVTCIVLERDFIDVLGFFLPYKLNNSYILSIAIV